MSRRWSRGFTFLELVIVVVIVGIMAAAAVPRYVDSLYGYRVDMAARRIAMDVAVVQARAKATSSSQTIVFTLPGASANASKSQYQINGMTDPDRPSSTYTVVLSDPPYQATLIRVELGGDTRLAINGYGVPDIGGTIVVQCGQKTKTIMIDATTAGATIQ